MFHGWRLSGFFCVGNILLQGGGIYILNALIEPLAALYGWSRGDFGTGQAIGGFISMLGGSLVSRLALRFSMRSLATAGALGGAAGYFVMGQTDNFVIFICALTLVWTAGQAFGGALANTCMSRWFVRHRGKAFGLANMGTSLSGATLPLGLFLLLQVMEIRTALWLISALLLFVAAPLCRLWVKEPAQMGLFPDGDTEPPQAQAHTDNAAAEEAVPWGALLRTRNVWCVGIVAAVGIMVAGLVGQLKLKFADSGFSSFEAMLLLAFTALCGAFGKYLWGWVSDKITALRAARLLQVMTVASLGLHFVPQNYATALLFAVCVGCCMGGYWTIFPSLTAYVFGKRRFSSVYSLLFLFVSVKSAGYYIIGFSYSRTGSYDMAYLFFIASLVLAFAVTWAIRIPGVPETPS